MAYLAGAVAIAFVIFNLPLWPIGFPLIIALLLADFVIEG